MKVYLLRSKSNGFLSGEDNRWLDPDKNNAIIYFSDNIKKSSRRGSIWKTIKENFINIPRLATTTGISWNDYSFEKHILNLLDIKYGISPAEVGKLHALNLWIMARKNYPILFNLIRLYVIENLEVLEIGIAGKDDGVRNVYPASDFLTQECAKTMKSIKELEKSGFLNKTILLANL
jgi:hypothetical protein